MAIAAIIPNILGMIVLTYYLYKRPHISDIRFKGFRLDWQIIRKINYLGLPMGLQQVLIAISALIVMSLVNHYGTACIAAFGIGNRIDMIILILKIPIITIVITIKISVL